ncbi:hypothetical protein SAMN05444724_2752 [Salinivibrio sp. ES.052]|nr:hypothetical protein SAMN05444724_2752 [Salinivibrio sp. ES.052]
MQQSYSGSYENLLASCRYHQSKFQPLLHFLFKLK